MAIITTNGSFGATAAVTSTTLNAVADAATFSDPVDGTSLELKVDGKLGIKDGGVTAVKLATDALELAYPVGSIYMNATVATNPGTLLGFGTWVEFSTGRILLGAGEGTDDQPTPEVKTFVAGDTGGEYNHTLTEDELAAHTHDYRRTRELGTQNVEAGNNIKRNQDVITASSITGGDVAHNNIQPYIAVHMWTRTA
jgi:hypothetical protein